MVNLRGIISTYASGVDLVVEWKIVKFLNLSETDGAWYCSPEFSFGGERWYLRIYPNGSSRMGSYGHANLALFKHFSHRSIKQSFFLSLKTAEGEKYNEQRVTKDFDTDNWFHKFNRFIHRSELSRRRTKLMPEGHLTVICTMKSSTSARSDPGNDPEHPAMAASTQRVGASTQRVGSSTQRVGASTQSVGASTQTVEEKCNTASASAECRHCKGTFNADSLSSHQKKCMSRSIKCPDCLEVVVLQTWLDGHECQQGRPEGARSVCEDYKKVLLGGRHHDLILKVGDKELRAHRDILRARSRVFESMLNHDMKEKNTGIIDMPDCDPNAMELFLSYVYCGEIEALDHNNMLGLYYVADKYEMMELKSECCNFIKNSLSLTNICSVIQLALKHSDSDLLECATGYFSDNMLDIMQTVEWLSFLRDNLTVGNELLMKSIKKLKNA